MNEGKEIDQGKKKWERHVMIRIPYLGTISLYYNSVEAALVYPFLSMNYG